MTRGNALLFHASDYRGRWYGLKMQMFGTSHVVTFNPNGGIGAMAPQIFENGAEQKLSKNGYRKDGYTFQGWVSNSIERAELAAAGVIAVDYTDEQEIAVDSDMTLYAVWDNPPLTLAAESANWSNGSITLKSEDSDTSGAEHSYTLEYCNENGTWVAVDDAQVFVTKGQNANNEEVWVVKLTDTEFSSRLGGIPTVHYRVEDENGRISGISTTRHRYGIFVGIDKFEGDWQKRLSKCVIDADNMKRAFSEYGGCYYVQSIKNNNATKTKILGSLDNLSSGLLKAGDILLFSYSSHGGVGSICCYGRGEEISAYELAAHFHNLPHGLGLVSIIDTCYSTSMVARNVRLTALSPSTVLEEEPSEHVDPARIFAEQVSLCLHSLCTARTGVRLMAQASVETSGLSDEEIGWLTSSQSNETSFDGVFTTECLYKRGWLKGGADFDGDDFVSFGELGRWGMAWMARNYDRYQRMSSYYHLPILNNIVAGSVPAHGVWAWLTAPFMLKSARGLDGEISLSWNAVDGAGTYAVFRTVKGSSETNYLASVSGLTYVDGKKCALDPNLEYEYYIRAENEVDVSEASDSVGGTVSENTLLKDFVIQHMTDAQITGTTLTEHPPIADGTVNYSNLNYDHDGDGFTTFEEYIIGSDPADARNKLSAVIEMTHGVPCITWSPNLNTNGIMRNYTIWGKVNLTDGVWHTPTNSSSRFFRVEVEMP